MESLIENDLNVDEVHLNNYNLSHPILAKPFLQENNSLTKMPPSFFEHIQVLQVLDLSHTSLQSLPPSISNLCLLEEFILRECSLLMEVPPEIGALKNLKLFDLEGTEVMYLPKEIGKLQALECLRVSLSTYADDHKDINGIEHVIPRMTISKLTKLQELSISVNPEAEWWEVEVLEGIMEDLLFLPELNTLKLYLPTVTALQRFLRLERYQVPLYSSLLNFRFVIGHCEQPPSFLQPDIEENFLKLEKCMKYMNYEGSTAEIEELTRNSRALYLRRHWTIEKLPIFDMRKLKYCLLMECNELQTLIHQEDLYDDRNKFTNHGGDVVLGSLQYLAIHFMKKLQRISKGPIGKTSLSCLRILALHTCPELTTIFTGCLLDNLQRLTELIVEDCPKVNCLVNLEEGTPWSKVPFLPNLRRVSLLDLPELVSISNGVSVAPQLDTLLVFNCMRLDYLSVMELSRDIKAIKGEIEWWDALKYGKLTWNRAFVQLKREGVLMDQLAEDTNSLQHFLELQMVSPDIGSSLRLDLNLSGDHHPHTKLTKDKEDVDLFQIDLNEPACDEILQISTQSIFEYNNETQSRYAGTTFSTWEPPCQVSGKSHNEDTNCHIKVPNQKHASAKKNYVGKVVEVEETLDDGYVWRKYGQKGILGAKYPRAFYRCISRHIHGCFATKQVQRSTEDPSVFEVTYRGKHTCPRILSTDSSSRAIESPSRILSTRDSSTATESALTMTDSHFELATRSQEYIIPPTEKNYATTHLVEVGKVIEVEETLDDGYVWRKYGQKLILGAKYPRAYYRCINKHLHGCLATKHVQRSTEDPSVFEVTYCSKHTCPRILSFDCSLVATESASKTLSTRDSSTATESASTMTDGHFDLATRPQALDYKKNRNDTVTWKKLVKVSEGIEVVDDGYRWRKYGKKIVRGSENPRAYYICSHQETGNCRAKKRVQRSMEDPSVLEITYKGRHTCSRLLSRNSSSTATKSTSRTLSTEDSSTVTESASTIIDVYLRNV